MDIVYCCEECGEEVESEGLTVDQTMAFPDHPSATILSVVVSQDRSDNDDPATLPR